MIIPGLMVMIWLDFDFSSFYTTYGYIYLLREAIWKNLPFKEFSPRDRTYELRDQEKRKKKALQIQNKLTPHTSISKKYSNVINDDIQIWYNLKTLISKRDFLSIFKSYIRHQLLFITAFTVDILIGDNFNPNVANVYLHVYYY